MGAVRRPPEEEGERSESEEEGPGPPPLRMYLSIVLSFVPLICLIFLWQHWEGGESGALL